MAVSEPPPPARQIVVSDSPVAIFHELPAVPESVAIARRLVVEELGDELTDARREDVLLAVSEAVTNAIRHGYRGTPGLVSIELRRIGAARVRITVGDAGLGLGEPSLDPGLGLGMELIRRVADAATFSGAADGGTVAEMDFTLS